ncbi:MAG: hypothetical protein AB8B93_17080 [Pseudomonadales bacterium]
MRYLNGVIGGVFLILTLLYAGQGSTAHLTCLTMLALATGLAFTTFVPTLPIALSRVLAVVTVATMFYFFAGFFTMASSFEGQWYKSATAFEAIAFLLSAFCLLAVLSDFSCRLKADCPMSRARKSERKGFFTVPNDLQKQIS